MRKIIRSYNLDWESEEVMKKLLNVETLPDFIIIEGFDDE